jgi:hypothetical protein
MLNAVKLGPTPNASEIIAAAKRAGEFLRRRMARLRSLIGDGIDKYDRAANEFVQFNLKWADEHGSAPKRFLKEE